MKVRKILLLSLAGLLSLSACAGLAGDDEANSAIEGSGHVAAREVLVASELSGKVLEVLVEEGDDVAAGDKLIRLDDEGYQAQLQQAQAAVELAQAQVAATQAQYDLALQGARLQEQPARSAAWLADEPGPFELPNWYFQKSEALQAAEAEVAAAKEDLDLELSNLEEALDEASNADLVAAEQELAAARAQYDAAQLTLQQAQQATGDNQALETRAQEQLDAAETELAQAQDEYDQLLSSAASEDLLEARARVAVARARYENARDLLAQLQSGEQSLQVQVAASSVQTAEAGLSQAQAALAAAQVQVDKAVVYAPNDGVVLTRNIEAGEVLSAGATAMVIGQLDPVELVIYIPEDRYGQIELGQQAEVTVDSFPDEVFEGTVIAIADEAEFTPRNVQTVDGRKSTVFAVKIRVPNADGKLKPGMPADAILEE